MGRNRLSGLLCKARRGGPGLVGGSGGGGVAPSPSREPSGVRVRVSTNLHAMRARVCASSAIVSP